MSGLVYEVMHRNLPVAELSANGICRILRPDFLPFSLWLEEAEDFDTCIQNLNNFYFWCASRLLTLDRQYVKEILNSIGALQARTDRERAQIALSYHCLSMTDVFWVRRGGEDCFWDAVNLYDNHLSNAFVDVSLRGRQMTVQNQELAPDLSTDGLFPKAWLRRDGGFVLLKDGGRDAVMREVLASRVCQCFDVKQVAYREDVFEGEPVSVSRIFTGKERSIVSREAFEIYAANHELSCQDVIEQLDLRSYHMMNLLDYLVGNTDRHWGNWGFLVDNDTNCLVSLHPLMDFNQSFKNYDDLEGGRCLPAFPRHITQREGAVDAVRITGWPQIQEIDPAWFVGYECWFEMLKKRMDYVKSI